MFNGIIFNQGIITKIVKRKKGSNIFIKSDLKLNNNNLGVSVACDGVCLTLKMYLNFTFLMKRLKDQNLNFLN